MELEPIVDLWRATFAPDVERAAHNAAGALPHDEWPTDGKALHAAWMKRAASPSTRDVVELMHVSDFVKATAKQILERLEAMATWTPHPIATRWMVDAFARRTRAPSLDGQKCFRRLFNLLVEHIDHAGIARFVSWLGTHVERIDASEAGAQFFDDGMRRVIKKSKARLDAARPLFDAEREALEAAGLLVVPEAPPPEVTREALLAAVYEAPWDDGPRLVLADYLQQRDDPRGELIALDLLPDPTREQRKRRRALLNEYGKAWFPEALERIVKRSAEYDRGFLARGQLMRTDRAPIELATFRALEVELGGIPNFDDPAYRGVEEWRGVPIPQHANAEVDARFVSGAPQRRVKHLGVRTYFGVPPARLVELLRPERWPNLTDLVVHAWTEDDWDPDRPTWIDDVALALRRRFPRARIAMSPFGTFDPSPTEIFLPNAIAKALVWDLDLPHHVAGRKRWLDWLRSHGVTVVVDAPLYARQLAPLIEGVPVRQRSG